MAGKRRDELLWIQIKQEYVTSDIGYRPLAKKHGIPFRTLTGRAAKEAWYKARCEYRDGVSSASLQCAQDAEIKRQSKHLITLQRAADRMAEIIAEVLEDAQTCKDPATGGYDTKKLRDLSNVMRDMLVITRNVYDLPSIQEQSAMDIAAERLRLEQRKADAAEKDANEGVEVVLVGDDLEDYAK